MSCKVCRVNKLYTNITVSHSLLKCHGKCVHGVNSGTVHRLLDLTQFFELQNDLFHKFRSDEGLFRVMAFELQ